jgi:putative membrane protein insertion efficiency factor
MRAALTARRAGPARPRDLGAAARAALVVLKGYKLLVSPLFTGSCRFSPSCSTYMAQAIREHGALRGGWLGVRRVLRCHPFGGHGFDPVPPSRA